MSRGLGSTQQKILLLLVGGLALGLSRSPRQHFKIIKGMVKGWQYINRRSLERSVRLLYKSQLVDEIEHADGTVTLKLNKKGKNLALRYDLEKMIIKEPLIWDKKWRIVIFDIPVKLRQLREAIRFHLKQLGFYKLQNSVFVHPYPCQNEVEFLIEFFNARKFIRTIEAEKIDNELDLKRRFNLI